jgi:hypothetical protein
LKRGRFPRVRPLPEKPLMTAENEKTSIGCMGNRIIAIQEVLSLFPGELPARVKVFSEDIIGYFNGQQSKRILF